MARRLICLLFVVACDGSTPGESSGYLIVCEADPECGSGLSCRCGFCTSSCTDSSECALLDDASECQAAPSSCAGSNICVDTCVDSADCPADFRCTESVCVHDPSTDAGSDGSVPSDAGMDGSVPDAEMPDANITCTPNTWICDTTGDNAHYCNAAGHVRSVDCHGQGCADGLCAPVRFIGTACGLLKNGLATTEHVGGTQCPIGYEDPEWSYTIWLDRGDELIVAAEAVSPDAAVEVSLQHPCNDGSSDFCTTVEESPTGGAVTTRRTANHPEAIRVSFQPVRETGTIVGARVSVAISVVPSPPLPDQPQVCAPDTQTCASTTVLYCSMDGLFEREHGCPDYEMTGGSLACADDTCPVPAGESCVDAFHVVRPASDVFIQETPLRGFNNDFDPGSSCFGIGQSGPDRVYRVDLSTGERVRVEVSRDDPLFTNSVYLLRDCADPIESCIAGSIGHRTIRDGGFLTTTPDLRYEAERDEQIFVVVDRELGTTPSDLFLPVITIRWTGTCTDGIQNGDELNVDCGGPCGGCPDGTMCFENEECESRRCESRRCFRPEQCGDGALEAGEQCDDANANDDDWCSNACLRSTCFDGVRNGDEASADEGGYCLAATPDTCRRALDVPLAVGDSPPRYEGALESGDLAAATNSHAPNCGIDGLDHAYRVVVETRSRLTIAALAGTDGEIDPTRTLTWSVVEDCGGAEIACSSSANIDQVFEPGVYIIWVDETASAASTYDIQISGEQL